MDDTTSCPYCESEKILLADEPDGIDIFGNPTLLYKCFVCDENFAVPNGDLADEDNYND